MVTAVVANVLTNELLRELPLVLQEVRSLLQDPLSMAPGVVVVCILRSAPFT